MGLLGGSSAKQALTLQKCLGVSAVVRNKEIGDDIFVPGILVRTILVGIPANADCSGIGPLGRGKQYLGLRRIDEDESQKDTENTGR